MEFLEKYDEIVFLALNKERFEDYKTLRSELEEGIYKRADEVIPQMVEELNQLANPGAKVKKDFYDYYAQFTPIKSLKKSQLPKVKLRKNTLLNYQRKLQGGGRIRHEEFLEFYLHWHCAEYFSEQWFLLNNKFLYFSKDFVAYLVEKTPYVRGFVDELQLPPIFLDLDVSPERSMNLDDDDYHLLTEEGVREMKASFDPSHFSEQHEQQVTYYQDMLQKSIDGKIYLLIKYLS